jgi:hypothetical protein
VTSGARARLASRADILAALALAAFVSVLALAPHAWYAFHTGDTAYFKSAYDEDSYLRLATEESAGGHRGLSSLALRALASTVEDATTALIVADAIFPALAALAAFGLAATTVRSPSARLAVALLLLFGQEFGSLASAAITHLLPAHWSLSWLRNLCGGTCQSVIPDASTSYFSLFRTPEPQLSIGIGLMALRMLWEWLQDPGGTRYAMPALAVVHVLMPWMYVFVALPLLVLESVLAAWLLASGRATMARRLLLVMVPAVAAAVLQHATTFLSGPANASLTRHVFSSSMPAVSPAVIYALGLLTACGIAWRWRLAESRALGMAASCALVPIVLMNQQLVTGLMVSTRDFERYSNYPVLVLGAVTLAAGLRLGVPAPGHMRLAATVILAVLVALLVEGQRFVVRGFEHDNDHAVAARRAIEMALPETTARRVVLANASLVAAVAARTRRSGEIVFVLDYTDLSRRTLPRPDGNADEQAAADAHRERLFEYFARLGMSPAEVGQTLGSEAASIGTRPGFLLHFLFHLADVWYPMTDSRQMRPNTVAGALPDIVADYSLFLHRWPAVLDEPAMIVTGPGLAQVADSRHFVHRAIGGAAAGTSVAQAYEQRRRGVEPMPQKLSRLAP